ncbi:MAG: hypothetical protein D6806_13480 [Deltaproteobacteria bacterium]|nr:MAG: hypothetical protein D6806_13480 [Deltaproteobacteria bacterium]
MAALVADGLLGASSSVVRRRPEAEESIGRLARVSGWIGLASALYGFWLFLGAMRLPMPPLPFVASIASAAVLVVLGFLFGYGMVLSQLSTEARKRVGRLRRKLSVYQQSLGWAALALAVFWLVLWIS